MTTDITELAQSLKAAADREMICRDVAETSQTWERTVTPENILALVEALEKAQRANGYLREQSAEWERKAISNFEDCAEMSARVEELESQRKLAFTASNRWADKFREAEKRIAELEFRSVTVKLPQRLQPGADGWDDWYVHSDDEGEYLKFDDVLAMLTAAGIKVEAE
ncbi:RelE family toxin-antitoxin system [Klebsiella pneumoniae]|nr:RelE family toxin-antitoxin system [Klebsiella pneumoniae]